MEDISPFCGPLILLFYDCLWSLLWLWKWQWRISWIKLESVKHDWRLLKVFLYLPLTVTYLFCGVMVMMPGWWSVDSSSLTKVFLIWSFFFHLISFLEDISPFCRATDAPVLDFWWRLLWVSKPEWAALFVLGRGIHVTRYLRKCIILARILNGNSVKTFREDSIGIPVLWSWYLIWSPWKSWEIIGKSFLFVCQRLVLDGLQQ